MWLFKAICKKKQKNYPRELKSIKCPTPKFKQIIQDKKI